MSEKADRIGRIERGFMTFMRTLEVATSACRRCAARIDGALENRSFTRGDIMKTSLLLALPLGLTLLSAPASARFFTYSGVGCQAAVPNNVSCIESNQFGVQNHCTSAVAIECPIDAGYGVEPNVTFVSFTGYDRSTVADLSCQVQKLSNEGQVLFTSTIKTDNNGPAAQLRSTFPGIGQGGFWRMRCSLPGLQAGQFSHLTTYSMLTSE